MLSAEELCTLKMSEVIEVALADLTAIESNPLFTVNMGIIHSDVCGVKCKVCFAGAFLNDHFKDLSYLRTWDDVRQYLADEDLDWKITHQLLRCCRMLDRIRLGLVFSACSIIDLPYEKIQSLPEKIINFAPYHLDSEMWYDCMWEIVTMLRKRGL